MGVVVFEYDVSKNLESRHKSRIFKKIDGCKVKLVIDNQVLQALEKSPDRDLASIRIVEKGQKICQATSDELAVALAKLEGTLEGKDKKKKHELIQGYRAEVVKKLEGLKGKLKDVPEAQWKKFLTKYGEAKKEYLRYKVSSAVEVTLGGLGVIASGIAMGGAVHTGGASLALGIVGMVRSVAKISSTLKVILTDVEKFTNGLRDDIVKMAKEFTEAKGKATGKDLARVAVNTIVGGTFFTTVSTADKKAESCGGKVAGAHVAGVKLSREVTASLNKSDELDKLLDTVTGKNLKKAQESLKKLQKNFSKLFESAANANAKADRVEETLKEIRKALVILKEKTSVLGKVEKALEALAALGLAAANAGVEIVKAGEEVLELTKASITLADEVLATTKEAIE